MRTALPGTPRNAGNVGRLGRELHDPRKGSFEVVSAILKSGADAGFTRQVITSGKAPLTPGSRARRTPAQARRLWHRPGDLCATASCPGALDLDPTRRGARVVEWTGFENRQWE